MATTEDYLSPPEVAELLRVGHNKVLTWILTGDLRATDFATYKGQKPQWRITRADLATFLARRATSPPSEDEGGCEDE